MFVGKSAHTVTKDGRAFSVNLTESMKGLAVRMDESNNIDIMTVRK